ncbi:hypothetical protein CA13_52150 [Planctomycetes bacterium CA13]|uniref:DUF4261 domain-containing protein n=1 Tax=Novipirellula herctigrandis TaxID=2527986 RepID=A0A5C5Z947_9BACT|nr:hypothetical protein CA13_52150 [Planctomycetes bacterium CA13]
MMSTERLLGEKRIHMVPLVLNSMSDGYRGDAFENQRNKQSNRIKLMESFTPITLRIPGIWSNPAELLSRIPDGFRMTPDGLVLPDGDLVKLIPMEPDDQFADIFQISCRRTASEGDMAIVRDYTVNIALTAPGGSLKAARSIMKAGAAIVQAGGGGVFIDNSALAHGGTAWVELAEDGSPDALSFAFVGIVRGKTEARTMGMNALGLHDVVMQLADLDETGESMIELIRYMASSENPIGDGHILADEHGLRFKAVKTSDDEFDGDSPMHNPRGRLKLISFKEIAEQN